MWKKVEQSGLMNFVADIVLFWGVFHNWTNVQEKTGYLNVMNIKKITEDMNFHDSIACINVISGSNEVISRSAFEASFFSSVDFSSKASWRLLFWSFSSFGLEDFFSSKRLLFPLRIFCPKNEFSNEVKSAVTVWNGEKQNVFIQIKIVEYEKNLWKFSNLSFGLWRHIAYPVGPTGWFESYFWKQT